MDVNCRFLFVLSDDKHLEKYLLLQIGRTFSRGVSWYSSYLVEGIIHEFDVGIERLLGTASKVLGFRHPVLFTRQFEQARISYLCSHYTRLLDLHIHFGQLNLNFKLLLVFGRQRVPLEHLAYSAGSPGSFSHRGCTTQRFVFAIIKSSYRRLGCWSRLQIVELGAILLRLQITIIKTSGILSLFGLHLVFSILISNKIVSIF